MEKRSFRAFLILLVLLTAGGPPPARANAVREYQEKVHEEVAEQVARLRKAPDLYAWIARNPDFSPLDRRLLQTYFPNGPLPRVSATRTPTGTVIQAAGLTVNLSKMNQRMVAVNGKEVALPRGQGLLQTMQSLAAAGPARVSAGQSRWSEVLLPSAFAAEENACIGKFEFSMRSPYPLLDTPVGYLPHLLAANIILSVGRQISNVFRDCKAQVADLHAILREQKLGIKEIDCGSDDSGSDRVIKFWIPQRDRAAKFMHRTFNLNYAYGVAEEEPFAYDKRGEEIEEEDLGKEKRKVYVFGTDELQEVRTLAPAVDEFNCSTTGPTAPEFKKEKAFVEPFRKIFYYIGQHDTCLACRKELSLSVRSGTAPSYFPPMSSLEKKRFDRKAKADAKERAEADREDAAEAKAEAKAEAAARRRQKAKGAPETPSEEETSGTSSAR